MRMTDAPSTELSIDIDASAEVVWDVITDLGTPALTSSEFRGAEWSEGCDGPAVGASFVGHNSHPAIGEWETTSYVTVADPGREFSYAVDNTENPAAVWTYRIEPRDGGVRLTQRAQIGPGPNGLSPAIERMPEKEEKIVARRLGEHETNMRANLERIKELAESRQGAA